MLGLKDKNSRGVGEKGLEWQPFVQHEWKIDLQHQRLDCDEALKKRLFDSHQVIKASSLLELIQPNKREQIKRAFQIALDSGETQSIQCCLHTPNTLLVYAHITISKCNEHQLYGTLLPLIQIEDTHDLANIFSSVFDNPHHGILIADMRTQVMACNSTYEKLSGYQLPEILGQRTAIFNSQNHNKAYYQQLWQALSNNDSWNGTILSRHASGGTFTQDLTIQKVTSSTNKGFYLAVSSDLSGKLERVEDVESGGVELLTQLPNKERFVSRLAKYCDELEQGQGIVVLALLPDLPSDDREIKRQFASYLKDTTHVLTCGYLGQGCFVVCVPFTFTEGQSAVGQISRSISRFFHSFKHAQTSVAESLKRGLTGVSVYQADARSPAQLVSHAYQAVLEVHAGHERRVNFYDRQIHNQLERKKNIEQHVLDTLDQGCIDVYFQPIVDLESRRIDKFEALCRFPANGAFVATTEEFVTAVEDLNRVIELDDLVLSKAITALPELREKFGAHICLSVNRSLNAKEELTTILQSAAKVLDSKQAEPCSVVLEFTESAYFENDEKNKALLSELRNAGVKIAVDDFGTGSTSFRYLKECLFDILKIDRVFIQNLQQPSRQFDVIQSLIQLAYKLNLEVVAEGVETEQELANLHQLGVRYIQGYFFSKPLPLNELKKMDHYCEVPSLVQTECVGGLGKLVEAAPHLDPGDPLSLIYQRFEQSKSDALPVIDGKVCVGVVDVYTMNLHLTPAMGTDLESTKENHYWHKPANRLMKPVNSTLHWHTALNQIPNLLSDGVEFPWCLVDDEGEFKGLVTQKGVLTYFTNNKYIN
ncbi:EAL domain-containing protein [Vibrio aquaticus]|uniref:EAL domain-containing protein n=1 Tax=Vibrio aquaticus TaxID=2496559 RepID=A0A3S0QE80_9VIBR|nr:EAL domain-containing protein [Vibrio aquaticus]RTZ16584.1 EAL domain-containing protein [Vibrio aquaticus]